MGVVWLQVASVGVSGGGGAAVSVVVRPEPIIPQFFQFLNSYNFNHYSRRTTTLFP